MYRIAFAEIGLVRIVSGSRGKKEAMTAIMMMMMMMMIMMMMQGRDYSLSLSPCSSLSSLPLADELSCLVATTNQKLPPGHGHYC